MKAGTFGSNFPGAVGGLFPLFYAEPGGSRLSERLFQNWSLSRLSPGTAEPGLCTGI